MANVSRVRVADDIACWTEAAAGASAGRDRGFVASPFSAHVARVEREQGAPARAEFLRAVLSALVERGRPRISTVNLPQTVKDLIEREYLRIEKDLVTAGDDHYDLGRHSMRCDFRIVGFGRTPAGVSHIDVGGMPRRLLWSGDAAQAWHAAMLLLRAGGHAPFYVSHLAHGISPMAFLLIYTREAQEAYHRTVADCLRMNPHVRGFLATSWWFDPALSSVAPHLTFLREGSLAHGAVLLRAGSTEGAQKNALAHSPRRQRMYATGEYLPVSYAVVWTRSALLKWASSN